LEVVGLFRRVGNPWREGHDPSTDGSRSEPLYLLSKELSRLRLILLNLLIFAMFWSEPCDDDFLDRPTLPNTPEQCKPAGRVGRAVLSIVEGDEDPQMVLARG
jgi:hypothetical protein